MKRSNLLCGITLTCLLVIPFSALAGSWSCNQGNNVREIHIQSTSPAGSVPCNVVYKKITEGAEDRILWSAQNDAAYCEEKAKEFVEKQISWGWSCEEITGESNSLPAATN